MPEFSALLPIVQATVLPCLRPRGGCKRRSNPARVREQQAIYSGSRGGSSHSRECLQRVPNAAALYHLDHITHVLRHALREAVLAGLAIGMGRFENTIFFFTTAVTSHRTCWFSFAFLPSPSSESSESSAGAWTAEGTLRTCLWSTPSGFGRLTTLPSSR